MAQNETKTIHDLMDAEEAQPAPGEAIYEVGDLIEGVNGEPYLVTWANALPDGTALDRVSVLELTQDLRGVVADASVMLSDVKGLTRKAHLDYDTTRKLHWGWFAGILPRSSKTPVSHEKADTTAGNEKHTGE